MKKSKPFHDHGAGEPDPGDPSSDDPKVHAAQANVGDTGDPRRLAELKAILDNAVDAIITINERGLIESVNPATTTMFGYVPDELMGRNISMLMPEPYRHQHDGYLDNYARTHERKIIGIGREVVAMRKDGSVFPIDLAVSESNAAGRKFFTGMIRDLSDRRRIESQLRVSARALTAARQGICVLDARQPNFPIESANPALTQITGHSSSWLLGKSISAILGGDSDMSLSGINDAMVRGESASLVLRCQHATGRAYWGQVDVSPVHDDDDVLTHYVVLVADVTDQQERQAWLEREVRERTRELEAAQAKLVQQERLAVLGRISGSIAHEIRNPLNAIKTSAYYLINARQASEEKQLEHLRRIDRQVSLINNVVSVLSDGARMPQPNRDPAVVQALIDDAISTIEIASTIQVKRELSGDLMPVVVDANQIAIVFRNLLRNARDAMSGGGTITIQANNVEGSDGEIHQVLISIGDTGTGIAEESLPMICEPLYTTKPHGMGLGLSISYSIIENNRGVITVDSKVGTGTTFRIWLPTREIESSESSSQSSEDDQ
ncbi:Sporulation kinase E [Rubripirellula amarantea]|uniref:Sensor protein FixL n=1 Tax=Rubripirellula amarantea TaxID=2527999 RepID=A0A5C5WMJ7_9BACT|nr:PAS domain-containing sensor histidine kinase [Rubripirellula amarantea]TWT51233.1 Sporulation kinase E [Rubripirellula amarantea]